MPRARTTTEFSRYADPSSMSERGRKAYSSDVARQNKESAKSAFIDSEASSYPKPKHTYVGHKPKGKK